MVSLVWLRRDLRLHDHAALAEALAGKGRVQPIFVLDTDVLARFSNPRDRRLSFIARTLCNLHQQLLERDGGLLVLHGSARTIIPRLADALSAEQVVAAEDYEPSAIWRDKAVAGMLKKKLSLVKDHLIFSPQEVLKANGTPFRVFTPYSKAWLARLTPTDVAVCRVSDKGRYADFSATVQLARQAGLKLVEAKDPAAMLQTIGYQLVEDSVWTADDAVARLNRWAKNKVRTYDKTRDMVAKDGTSQLSPYLRFGLVSVRECMRKAQAAGHTNGIKTWIKELIWREFYAMILFYFPESTAMEWNERYRDKLPWPGKDEHFTAWQEGRTGYPIVDAAMRQLKELGWMHNRARMIVASFLTKDLHIDWRRGEEHFAQYLMDYEQASNVGGWQWAASTGTDAQPWFRIFNPVLQGKKFDPDGEYIRRYVPELADRKDSAIHTPAKQDLFSVYPAPIVDHQQAREKTLAIFKKAAGQR